jgi:hypothetical protein
MYSGISIDWRFEHFVKHSFSNDSIFSCKIKKEITEQLEKRSWGRFWRDCGISIDWKFKQPGFEKFHWMSACD